MSISTSTAERAPRSVNYTPETKQLFINAEELTEDVGKTAVQLWSGHLRTQPLTIIRHCIMYLLREEFYWNYYEIGYVFNKHHSSCLYACRRIKELKEINDPQVIRYLLRLTRYNGTNTQAQETERLSCSCKRSQRS